MKKRLIMFLATVVLLGTAEEALAVTKADPASTVNVQGFSDTKGHWGETAIEGAVQKGYVDGYPDGSFKPDADVTRAEFVKMIDSALHVSVSAAESGDAWYVPYINAAVSAGYHDWSDFTTGDWNTAMTRKEMARIAVRAATGIQNNDDPKWMYLATKAGLIMGMDDTGTLGEEETTTRAQSVTIIERVLSNKTGQTLPTDKHAVSRGEVAWHGTNVYTMWPRYFSAKNINSFNLNTALWQSSDGIYHEEVMEYIVVDMEDPNDPFRSEIEGMPFRFRQWEANGNQASGPAVYHAAPVNSYVSFSKVKATISGQYPKNLYVNAGGGMQLPGIVPKDAVSNERQDWRYYYSQMETPDTIYFTKEAEDTPYVQWNIDHGYNPYFVNDIPSAGGTYYWVKAQVHPKGDMYAWGHNTMLSYIPNLRYMKTYGPQFTTGFEGLSDYTVSN